MIFNLKRATLGAIATSLMFGVIACQPTPRSEEGTANDAISEGSTGEMPGEGITVASTHSSLQEERFQTEIINRALQELGYETEDPTEIEYATMLVAIANGDLDYTAVNWDKLHADFYDSSGGDEQLQKLGTLVPGVLQGYQVDKKTADENQITSLEQLKDPEIAKLFDTDGNGKANLTGCNPGWGCELVIEHHLDAYGLRDTVEHDQGQYSALMVNTVTRYEQDEPVLFYTWTPLWVGDVLKPGTDTTWLEVPFTDLPEEQGEVAEADTTADGVNLGFVVDTMLVVANREFVAENPAAQKLFEAIEIPLEDIINQNKRMHDGEDSPEDISRHVDEWISEHQKEFDGWVAEARQAGS